MQPETMCRCDDKMECHINGVTHHFHVSEIQWIYSPHDDVARIFLAQIPMNRENDLSYQFPVDWSIQFLQIVLIHHRNRAFTSRNI